MHVSRIMGSGASLLAEVDNDRELFLDDLKQLLGSSADPRSIELFWERKKAIIDYSPKGLTYGVKCRVLRDELFMKDAVKRIVVPIFVIPFEKFKEAGSFPRYPECQSIVKDIDMVGVEHSLIIFISHCWLRGIVFKTHFKPFSRILMLIFAVACASGWSGAPGWDGRPHPDNDRHTKYRLCVEGIEKLLKNQLSEGSELDCYIWLDFGCINQGKDSP